MKSFLKGVNLWNTVEKEIELLVLKGNASQAQVKQYEKDIAKRYRTLFFLHLAVSDSVFSRIMGCELAKQAWSKLKEEFMGSARSKQMPLQNLSRSYELLRMKESQLVHEFVDIMIKLVNHI